METYTSLALRPELQIRKGIEYSLKIIFLSSDFPKNCLGKGHNIGFYGKILKIIPKISCHNIWFSPIALRKGGGRVVRRCWVNFQCLGVLLIWIIVGQGPVALAVGAGGGCLDIFSLILSLLFLPLFGRRPNID